MSEKLRLLRENNNFNYELEILKEDHIKNMPEQIILRGILQKADVLNQNGRIYPRHILEREINNYQKFINENRAYGELDHPDSSVVELSKTSHMVVEATMDDDGVVWGAIKVLTGHSCGDNLSAIVKHGGKIGISSRGVGSTVVKDGNHIVQDDYQIICWDVVSEPSTPNAFVMQEGRVLTEKEIQDVNNYFTKEDKVDRIINEIIRW